MMNHGRNGGRPRFAGAATALLALGGAGLIGAGVLTQESVPPLAAQPQAVSNELAPATAPATSSPAAGAPSTQVPPADVEPVLPEAEPVSVSIPSIEAGSPTLVSLGLQPDGSVELPEDYDLAGWYRRGPTPGELGPAVIVGHVDSVAEGPAVFFRLAELQPGAEILVDRADGTTAVFTVDRIAQYPKDAFPITEVYGDTDHAALRLITCGGDFDRASGDYRDNIVVYARLLEVG